MINIEELIQQDKDFPAEEFPDFATLLNIGTNILMPMNPSPKDEMNKRIAWLVRQIGLHGARLP